MDFCVLVLSYYASFHRSIVRVSIVVGLEDPQLGVANFKTLNE